MAENWSGTIIEYMNSPKFEEFVGFSDYHVLGLLYVHNKQYNKAIEAFEKQFTIVDNIADAYYYLGLAYKGKSNIEEATIQFNKALLLLKDTNRHRIYIGFSINEFDVKKEIKN